MDTKEVEDIEDVESTESTKSFEPRDPSLFESMRRNGGVLSIFAILTTLVISLTWLGTRERIEAQQRLAQARLLLEILAAEPRDNDLLNDEFELPAHPLLGSEEPSKGWRARFDGEVRAVILKIVAPDGYTDAIELLLGVRRDGTVLGARVLKHRETPGLGDKIELKKAPWILSFNGRKIGDPPAIKWRVRRDQGDFDQFTGATITPRAVVASVFSALRYAEQERARLFEDDSR